MERRKDHLRRRLTRLLPILILYARRRAPMDPKQIARAVGCSTYTVRKHLRVILSVL